MLVIGALIVATFVSEDAACISAGLLIQRGELGAGVAVVACGAGILLGDLGLWAIGRCGGRLLGVWPAIARRVTDAGGARLRHQLDRRPALALLASRALPGSRLPLYVGAGLVGMPAWRFASWAACAAALWTPVVVLGSSLTGHALASVAGGASVARPWWFAAVAAVILLAGLTLARKLASPDARRALAVTWGRWRRWEFWPSWLFYLPVAGWVALLALRYRGFGTIAAANPGIRDGGIAGESKFEILSRLPAAWTLPTLRIGQASADAREREAADALSRMGWPLPVVLKPDVGQRGMGVRLARSRDDVARYIRATSEAVLMQPYHPGPGEAGILYHRVPGARQGRILAITHKCFPEVIGDGTSTLRQLIARHPRFRLQANLFLRRHRDAAALVLAAGERFQLTIAGNHAQGTIFRDGAHLWTPALEARIDAIAQSYPGFFIGRFDVKYRDVEAFRAGADLAIVELNGATGEPTNVYAPEGSLVAAYRGLFRQWTLVFRTGDANRRAGVPATGVRRLAALVGAHLAPRTAWDISD